MWAWCTFTPPSWIKRPHVVVWRGSSENGVAVQVSYLSSDRDLKSHRVDDDSHFNDDDEDHFLGIDSEDGHEDEEPLPPLALPLQNEQGHVTRREIYEGVVAINLDVGIYPGSDFKNSALSNIEPVENPTVNVKGFLKPEASVSFG
ncbi:hypothetical protein AVEN_126899-1 [Araneus ventricosus]|uniref:Uncharacterized protein n=1 Tax=Araneus ventricosus TaxID=182803 RepID=A0A4Y2C0K3_ARAVE|nr:hypothetical protein AVEN_126899-1 [Araneus ventricosus]